MPRLFLALLTLGLLAATPLPANAAPSVFSCDTYLEGVGEHTQRMMALDPAHGRVVDGTLDWHDGRPSPVPIVGLMAYVRQDGKHVEWGANDVQTGRVVDRFSFDLASGAYLFTGAKETLAQGRCWLIPDGT